MNEPSPPALLLVLADEDVGGRVVVPLESFLHFDHWVREQLQTLEDHWAPMAAPRAARSPGADRGPEHYSS